jgi:Bax protein
MKKIIYQKLSLISILPLIILACQRNPHLVSTSAKPIVAEQNSVSVDLTPKEQQDFENQISGNETSKLITPDLKDDKQLLKSNKQDDVNSTEAPKNNMTIEYCLPENAEKSLSKIKVQNFICKMLPKAIRLEKLIFIQRIELQKLIANENKGLTSEEKDWISELKKSYKLSEQSSLAQLLARVDIVPLALMLAQAAIETNWGQSRAAQQAQNYFGIHGSFKTDECLPALGNASVCIKKYESMDESISDYLYFLNTVTSAENFRQMRLKMRQLKQSLDPVKLSSTLLMYSEIGWKYAKLIQQVIVGQNLSRFVFPEDELASNN